MFLCPHSNGPPREPVPKTSPEVELEVVHEKKPPSASRAAKRTSNVRPDTGESRKPGQKKKTGSRTSPQAITTTLATMPEDVMEDREPNELVR